MKKAITFVLIFCVLLLIFWNVTASVNGHESTDVDYSPFVIYENIVEWVEDFEPFPSFVSPPQIGSEDVGFFEQFSHYFEYFVAACEFVWSVILWVIDDVVHVVEFIGVLHYRVKEVTS